MRNLIKVLGNVGVLAIIFATGYFYILYDDFQQLIISLGFAGTIIIAGFLYVYNWIKDTDEELKEINESVDRTRDYIREVEGKLKWMEYWMKYF